MHTSEGSARAVAAISTIETVPTLLQVLCEITGLRFAAVVRIAGSSWVACAVRDDLRLGVSTGAQLGFLHGFATEPGAQRAPIVVARSDANSKRGVPRTPNGAPIETFISAPIVVANRRYFGILCALDTNPLAVTDARTVSMFTQFASLIAMQLEQQSIRRREHMAMLDERAAGELREQFMAILGHDLRNPLQAVFAIGDILERRLTDPADWAIAARIKTNVHRMSSLIDDVLDFARGRLGGGINLEIAEVENLHHGVAAVIQELRDAQPDREVIANIEVAGAVCCDLGRVQQVVSNLLGNAITHGAAGSPVRVSVVTDAEDLIIDVWNAGEPIPPQSLEKIFEPFWRHSVSASRQGLGLGLHICSQIVRAHDGRIAVNSTREHGTRFTVRLPLGTTRVERAASAGAAAFGANTASMT
jgi:signal transduction histidine kinase